MLEKDLITTITSSVAGQLGIIVADVTIPPQGMDSDVVFIEDSTGKEYVVKYGGGVMNDVKTYELLQQHNIEIPVPKLYGHFMVGDKPAAVLERIMYPLLESIPVSQMFRYIPAMISTQKAIHAVMSDKAGPIINEATPQPWKEIILSKFNGTDDYLQWEEIAKREGLDGPLVLSSVEKLVKWLERTDLISEKYSLLHTDYNQRNLFVNPDNADITGIIDWGEAMFGDPIYDFSRIRMYIWHFNLGQDIVDTYYATMQYSPEEKQLDDMYWICRVVEYLAYYSEELNGFSIGRIKLHQDFLRQYQWPY